MTKTLLLIGVAVALLLSGCAADTTPTTANPPNVTTRSEMNVVEGTDMDFNIPMQLDATNLQAYLGIDGVKYVDIREYEEYIAGHLDGFELIPFYAWIYDLDAVTQRGSVQLYGGFPETPVPVYAESDAILETFFPKDQHLVLICRSGNRVNGLLALLSARGWDEGFFHSAGGMLDYDGQASYTELITQEEPAAGWGIHDSSDLTRLK